MKSNDLQHISDIYKGIKIVKGVNFVTIENTKFLTNKELLNLIPDLMAASLLNHTHNVSILVESKFDTDVDWLLKKYGFEMHDEIITVHKNLELESVQNKSDYKLKDLNEVSAKDFKSVWKEVMAGSLNAPSSLTLDEQMQSVELELGTNYKDSCLMAFDKGRPIGVTMPHIEPGTHREGRIFYFGLIPEERGKGKSRSLHQQTLKILKSKFNASYYIGCTSHRNKPMLKTFLNNGCEIIEKNKVYKRINNSSG
jgi:hypothetical protein